MLELHNVETFYGNIQALKSISMEIAQGEIVTLIGANGAGKSTTLMSISGVVPPRTGEIRFEGQPIQGLPPNAIVSMGISQVPEGRRIFPYLTVLENLQLAAFARTDKDGIQRDIERVFAIFSRLEERKTQKAGTMSGGEQQMLTICRTLMGDPNFIMIDEPTEGLAPKLVEQVGQLIEEIAQRGVSVLLVEQKLNIALKISQRLYIMGHGQIVFEGTPDDLKSDESIRKEWLEV